MPCNGAKPYDPEAFSRAKQSSCRFKESGVQFVINDRNLGCYLLDGGYFTPQDRCLCPTSSGSGARRCDGLLIGCVQGKCYVVFLDLKRGGDEDVAEQIVDTICYFRCGASGESHHAFWAERERLKGHKVVGLVMNDKPPKRAPQALCGKKIHWRSVGRKRAWSSFEELLSDIEPI